MTIPPKALSSILKSAAAGPTLPPPLTTVGNYAAKSVPGYNAPASRPPPSLILRRASSPPQWGMEGATNARAADAFASAARGGSVTVLCEGQPVARGLGLA